MTDNEFTLFDRLTKIKSTIEKYGEENFAISFSGGKDSTVLSALVDMACPENKIPRVFADTGIEFTMIRSFVKETARQDSRVVIIQPSTSIKKTLEEEGYPFKSKEHSKLLNMYQRKGHVYSVDRYLMKKEEAVQVNRGRYICPQILRYQFTADFQLRVSDKCCLYMKEQPLKKWHQENRKSIMMTGIMTAEGGRRQKARCIVLQKGKIRKFQPLVTVSKEWEDWFIRENGINICDIYKPPYNFERTGCKGCPFAIHIQEELDVLQQYFPAERRQCEYIWEPVYREYRRLGYRLKDDTVKMEQCK